MPMIMGNRSEPTLPALTKLQQQEMSGVAALIFTQRDWKIIDQARRDFAWCRWAATQAIEYSQFETRLELMVEAASNLVTALSGNKPYLEKRETQLPGTHLPFDKMSMLLWREVEVSGYYLPEIVVLLHSLGKNARRTLRRTQRGSGKDAWQHDWDRFVHLLASVFENRGVKPTAAKSSRAGKPKLSVFVAFVWTIIGTLPSELRAHIHSQQAMINAVAKSLKFHRSLSVYDLRA